MCALCPSGCVAWAGYVVAGKCKLVDAKGPTPENGVTFDYPGVSHGVISGGYPINITAEGFPEGSPPLFWASVDGTSPVFTQRYRFDSLTWRKTTFGVTSMKLMAHSAAVQSSPLNGPAAMTDAIGLETQPGSVAFQTIPPSVVQVGEPILIKGVVRISSGAPLVGARVTLETAPVGGARTSPLRFLSSVLGSATVQGGSEPPTLQDTSTVAISDEEGIVRFVVQFSAGPLASQTSLVLKAGDVSSQRTNPIAVLNEVSEVSATNVSFKRVAVDGIGSPYTAAVLTYGLPPETFPTEVELRGAYELEQFTDSGPPLEVTLTVRLAPLSSIDGEVFTVDTSRIPTNASYIRRSVAFRVFTEAEVEKLRQQEAAVNRAMARLFNFTATELQGLGQGSAFEPSSESSGKVGGGQLSVRPAAYTELLDSVEEAVMATLFSPTDASAAVPADPSQLIEYITLLTGGTVPSSASPQGPSSNSAIVIPITQVKASH